ncbi:MAG: DUF4286 family protein [Crocinitomicaceae bacterium]|nr:DUF4286 family protein [Crocinitomicaceae bacterium]
MIIYNVTVNIDFDVQNDWLNWMKSTHIPDVLATNLFVEAKLSRVLAEEEGGATYSIQYLCEDQEKLDEYQEKHAPALQQDHIERYAGKFVAFRTLLKVEKHFT